jgi:hypothetical protein
MCAHIEKNEYINLIGLLIMRLGVSLSHSHPYKFEGNALPLVITKSSELSMNFIYICTEKYKYKQSCQKHDALMLCCVVKVVCLKGRDSKRKGHREIGLLTSVETEPHLTILFCLIFCPFNELIVFFLEQIFGQNEAPPLSYPSSLVQFEAFNPR